jgi:hypothetical protein
MLYLSIIVFNKGIVQFTLVLYTTDAGVYPAENMYVDVDDLLSYQTVDPYQYSERQCNVGVTPLATVQMSLTSTQSTSLL